MAPKTARINDELITLLPKETLLHAALRNGIAFPNSCRVGGCGTCKCRLLEGDVKELTETGYLLSAEELQEGTILACQSVPKSNVTIEVKLAASRGTGTRGHVVGQEKVTHDITRLRVQLDERLNYRPGQFADVTFADLPGVVRSYSFGTPPTDSGQVTFYIRRVPDGRLSSFVDENALEGKSVVVGDPSGDFWLREGSAPLLMVAGGSGLPPILAMLQRAAALGSTRPVTLLFGAREERDLYALAEIEALRQSYPGDFRFIPVLSLAQDTDWQGERGLVTDKLPALLEHGAHAYLCGPPAMVDRATLVLEAHGIAREHIHSDRFTTRADVDSSQLAGTASPVAGAFHYLKFALFYAIGLFSAASLLAGGGLITAGLLLVLVLYIVGDAIGGDDTSTPTYSYPRILTAQLWLALPLLTLIVFVSVWSVCAGDPLGFGGWVGRWAGYDVLAARATTSTGHHVSAWLLTGLMIGMIGTIPAHELTHRTWDRTSMFIGRWLLAFSLDTTFAIEHVYGHHRYVSTAEDPATAPRGRNVYMHILASTLKGNVSAWTIEAQRLDKKRLRHWSFANALLRGQLMSVALVALAYAMGGLRAAGFFVACALWGKALLEIVNYMEHYGMVRSPEAPVEPRHSWNTNRRVSSWALFNLTRHSHHHAHGEVPFQDLRPYPDAPVMISGYLTTIVIALIPPLWHRLMTPRVLAWDSRHASLEERVLAARANANWRGR